MHCLKFFPRGRFFFTIVLQECPRKGLQNYSHPFGGGSCTSGRNICKQAQDSFPLSVDHRELPMKPGVQAGRESQCSRNGKHGSLATSSGYFLVPSGPAWAWSHFYHLHLRMEHIQLYGFASQTNTRFMAVNWGCVVIFSLYEGPVTHQELFLKGELLSA